MLSVSQISVAYGKTTVVQGVSFELEAGQIGCLLGPSGCGKTSLLRAIAGFEPIGQGQVRLAGRMLSSESVHVVPEKRGIGMVFQDFALFPHLTVANNIRFGVRHLAKEKQQQVVTELLHLVGLPEFGERYPHQLSGGQQQRVALARALAPEPEVLLLDEPFSGLDADLREGLAQDIRRILKARGISALMVTHDQFEAFSFADYIGVMQQGQLQQWGDTYALYHEPNNRFVADFIGHGALILGQVQDDGRVRTELGLLTGHHNEEAGTWVDVLIRPDDILHDDFSDVTATVLSASFRGSHILYRLALAQGEEVLCLAPSHHQHPKGMLIGIRLEMDHLVLFPKR